MNVTEKVINILKELGYKVFENVELKGKSGLTYAIDVYAVKEDPFCRIRVAVLIPQGKITKDMVLQAKMILSDVESVDRVIIINTSGIEKEAYKLAETGTPVLIVSLDALAKTAEEVEEFQHYAFKLLVDEDRARSLVKQYLLNSYLASAKVRSVELVYKPYYLIYYRTTVDEKQLFGGMFVDAVTGKIETKLATLAPKALSLIQKKLYKASDIPTVVEEPKIDEDRAKKVAEHLFVGEQPEIVQCQLVYLPVWRVELVYKGRTYLLEIDGVEGSLLSEPNIKAGLLDKVLTYLYEPWKALEDFGKKVLRYLSVLGTREKKIIIFILLILILLIISISVK
ncbi:MAG: restriction endonuclease [bacterium]|nr:restriction endonuclease [bacterium]